MRPSVVQVLPGGSGGTGVVLSRDGELVVVTNAHVARGPAGTRLRILSHRRAEYPARIEYVDPRRDLALLTIASRAPGDLLPATLADGAPLRPGQLVLAVGHPLGLAHAVTAGVVHAVGPLRGEWERGLAPRGVSWLQADIMLAPGNSGGPLADIEGRVIGINTMIVGGLALAVPAAEVRALLQARREAVPA
jgi:serine protease Do